MTTKENFCDNCGNRFRLGSLFCEKCGHKIKEEKKEIFIQEQTQTSYNNSIQTPPLKIGAKQPLSVNQKPLSRLSDSRKYWIKPLTIITMIIFGVIAAGIFYSITWWTHLYPTNYLGDEKFSIDKNDNFNIDLMIDNADGNILIEYIESDKLIEAKIKIYGVEGVDKDNAKSFEYNYSSGKHRLNFNADNDRIYFTRIPYKYDIYINISHESTTELFLEGNTGNVSVISQEPTIFKRFDIKVDFGSCNIDFGGSSVIDNPINIEVSGGFIDLDFSPNTTLNTSEVNIKPDITNLNIKWDEVKVIKNTFWNIDCSSANIDINITQSKVTNITLIQTFQITNEYANVNIYYNFTNVGFKVTTKVTSGNVNLPNGRNNYISSNYSNSLLKFDFSIEILEGNIKVSQ